MRTQYRIQVPNIRSKSFITDYGLNLCQHATSYSNDTFRYCRHSLARKEEAEDCSVQSIPDYERCVSLYQFHKYATEIRLNGRRLRENRYEILLTVWQDFGRCSSRPEYILNHAWGLIIWNWCRIQCLCMLRDFL
jgi:hypothetical protein